MTTTEYIAKAKCCSGQLMYEAVIHEQNGELKKYKEKETQANIMLIIVSALECVEAGGNCLTDEQAQKLKEKIDEQCGCCDEGFEDIGGASSGVLIRETGEILLDEDFGIPHRLVR